MDLIRHIWGQKSMQHEFAEKISLRLSGFHYLDQGEF